ncbi:MAG: NupC/NupG family nucleoside CNT transporter [Bryobacteraceae bacterium]|nr:NupC/NupG family nucleoside CNT transporter [Bryobacterales bacterium]MEB2361199.1 NupC/NupG family nucleoside CNT transporter [Bryobacterales bacterium]NUN02001.1 NupC/NupG family nucleoside CNT transporter [Bryobacteraceae bacterium]
MGRFTGLLGIAIILATAYLFSTNRRAIRPQLLLWGLGLQFAVAFLVLRTGFGWLFQAASAGVNALLEFAETGSQFVFGPLGAKSGPFGVIFAFQVLPIVIFIASFFSILYYFGVMQVFVRAMAVVMQRVMGASGAESTNVAASIFMGQTEAPLTVRPFLAGMTQSELFTIMTSGMAHVSGAVMAAYVKIAGVDIKHLLTAVIMTAPATILLAKMLMPETEKPETAGNVKVHVERPGVNVIDAAARGAGEGLHLALNIGAMLIAFLALIAMANGILGWVHSLPWMGWLPPTLQQIFGHVFSPVAWVIGVSWKDSMAIGNLLGTRLVLNEFVAFLELAPLKEQLDPRSFVIATYALCGFANFSSIAIQIGGIGALAPSRKSDLARLGLKAVAAGTMANFMSACIAGMLL